MNNSYQLNHFTFKYNIFKSVWPFINLSITKKIHSTTLYYCDILDTYINSNR